jgi:hypothetical protein
MSTSVAAPVRHLHQSLARALRKGHQPPSHRKGTLPPPDAFTPATERGLPTLDTLSPEYLSGEPRYPCGSLRITGEVIKWDDPNA